MWDFSRDYFAAMPVMTAYACPRLCSPTGILRTSLEQSQQQRTVRTVGPPLFLNLENSAKLLRYQSVPQILQVRI
jgi:hypothetical protein